MRKAMKYRLCPTKAQTTILEQTLEACRWVYNKTLEVRKNAWEQAQRSPERAKRRKIVARVHARIANRRNNVCHQESRKLVKRCDVIAIEDLSVNQMVHNHCLAKSIQDAAWSQFTAHLAYKAAYAGRQFVAVNPAYTSQDCSQCG